MQNREEGGRDWVRADTHLADTESEDNSHELNCTQSDEASK